MGLTKRVLDANPMTHLIVAYQEILFHYGPVGHWISAAADRCRVGRRVSRGVLGVRPAARFVRGGRMNAIEIAHVTKIYRRYGGRQLDEAIRKPTHRRTWRSDVPF